MDSWVVVPLTCTHRSFFFRDKNYRFWGHSLFPYSLDLWPCFTDSTKYSRMGSRTCSRLFSHLSYYSDWSTLKEYLVNLYYSCLKKLIQKSNVIWIGSQRANLMILRLCVWYPTLCEPMDCSSPGFSVHGILQARHWSGLPCPPPGALLNRWMEPVSLCCTGGWFFFFFFNTSAT